MASIADRLSLLTDDILIDILSRLSIHKAIATGVLSKRWRYLWTHITSLNIFDTRFRKEILSDVLPKLSNVHNLTLDYSLISTLPIYPSLIPFFSGITDRKILQVKVFSIGPLIWAAEHNRLISLIFQLRSLVVLELGYRKYSSHNSLLDTLNLPINMNLKVLKLRVCYEYTGCDCYPLLLKNIIQSCPSLEDLSVSVKTRLLSPESFRPINVLVIAKPVTIDVCNLKKLKLDCDHLERFSFTINTATALEKVDLRGEFGTLDRRMPMLQNIFEVMSNARSLSLGSPSITNRNVETTMLSSQVHLKCLPNLVHLKCAFCSIDEITNLLDLLSKCPILEVLVLNFKSSSKDEHLELLQCDDVACGSLGMLKRVVMNFGLPLLERGVFYVVKNLLGKASVLERLIINATCQDDIMFTSASQCHELQLCKYIFALPGKSELCQVEYSGVSLKSSNFERI